MKILRFLAPLLLLAATAFGQVSMFQVPSPTYTDKGVARRTGTYNKYENTLVTITDTNGVNTFGSSTASVSIAANTAGSGWSFTNPNAATSSNQRYSPYLEFEGFGHQTAGSYSVKWRIFTIPAETTTSPNGKLSIQTSVDGAGFSEVFSISNGSGAGTVNANYFYGANGLESGTDVIATNQLRSLVATGTAPLTVNSTTLVANLHAATADSSTSTTTATNATNGATVSTSTNASFFPLFAASSTNGNQPFNLGTGLTFNPSTNNLSTTTFTGALTGNASTATTATTATSATNTAITDDTSTNATMYPTWVTTTTGNLPQKVSSTKMTFNPSTATLTVANLAGNASTATSATSSTTATTATNATNGATVASSTNASFFPLFAASSSNGNQPFNLGTGLSFNPSTNVLATTTFSGALSGNATTATNATNSTNQAVTDDTTTNATMFPVWVTANTGNLPQKVSSTKLFYNPSTSLLTNTGNLTIGASTSQILGAAGNMTITAGTGNSRTLALQSTTAGGTATTFLTGDASQNTTLAGNLTLGASTSTITGAAGNMTIVAGTGNSRTMALQTTTSGGTATTAFSLNATQDATVAGNLTVSGGGLTFAGSTLITGGAGNMQITAGTGASRQMTLRTTTSGSTATTALTLGADQSALIAGPAATDGAAISASTALNLPAATTALSSIRLAHGAAPTSPVNGDFWTTTAGLFGRINGATVTYGAAGAGTVSVVGAGSLTSTALVTGGGTTTLQTPSATATMDSSGNISTPGTLTVGNAATTAGGVALTQGTTLSTGTTNITIQAPTSVTSYIRTLPGAVGSTGVVIETVSGSTQTESVVTTLPSGLTIPAPVLSTGATASGSGSYDLSGSSGSFKTQTGAGTIGPGALTFSGIPTFTAAARSSGVASYFTVTTPADTAQTASTESIGASFTAATRQWATGALTTQRERVFAAPTYGFVGASTLTTAINVDIADPIQGTNATLTNKYGLRVNNQQITGTLTANTGTNLIGPLVDSVDGTTPLNNINQVVATGTAYTMTASYASLDFGTTDPILTIANAGTYSIYVSIQFNLVGATYATYDSVTAKLRRTNNTAADLTGSTFGTFIPTITTITAVGPQLTIGPIKYTTTNTNDTVTVQATLNSTPSVGSVTASACTITAIRAY